MVRVPSLFYMVFLLCSVEFLPRTMVVLSYTKRLLLSCLVLVRYPGLVFGFQAGLFKQKPV